MRTHTTVESPIGELTLVNEAGVLCGLFLAGQRNSPRPARLGQRVADGFEQAVAQLTEYFAGERTEFSIPTAAHGDEFQHRVWSLVKQIPFGETRTYGELAHELGDPSLARAVGGANAANPLCIVVPCHRVVGSGGALTGYAGGLARKRYLLDLERPVAQRAATLF